MEVQVLYVRMETTAGSRMVTCEFLEVKACALRNPAIS